MQSGLSYNGSLSAAEVAAICPLQNGKGVSETKGSSMPDISPEAKPSGDGDFALEKARLVQGRLLVLLAAVMWSSSGFFAKSQAFKGWPGPLLAFWRALFACFVIVPLVRRPRFAWLMIPCALAYATLNFSYLMALSQGTAANAIWLQNIAPVWVLLVGVFFLGERATKHDWWMIGAAALGISLILGFEMGLFPSDRSTGEFTPTQQAEAAMWGLLSGMMYAVVVLCLRALRGYESAWIQAVNHIVTVIALSPYVILSLQKGEYWPSGYQFLLLAGFGILQLGLPYVLFTRALRTLPGHEAAGIALLEPVLVPVWAFLAHGEVPAWWTMVGGGLIFAGLCYRYGPRWKTAPVAVG